MSNSFFDDNEDLRFYIEREIDWEPLVRLTEYEWQAEDGFATTKDAVEFYRDILTMVGELSAREIAPLAAEIDRSGVSMKDSGVVFSESLQTLFSRMGELGLHGMCIPRELGGMNCPLMLYFITSELIARSDVSIMAHFGFHGGIALSMLMYSFLEGTTTFQAVPPKVLSTRFEKEISEIITGAAWGAMDITEANAGSDMSALRCIGESDREGRWFVSGEKILITSGHGKYHFVIARTEPASESSGGLDGLKRLSLFLVQTYEEDEKGQRNWLATISGLEKKLGHNGSATVTVSFDKTPAHLIGKRGEGFKQMLMLMNNARISVGFESLGCCEAAFRMARDYASLRPSMGKMIDRHEMIADYLDEMETDIIGIRALAVYAAFHEEMAQKLRIKLITQPPSSQSEHRRLEREQHYHQRKSRMVTPLIKYLAAEKAVEMAHRCIQIHGGYGYTKDYGAEKLLRDAVVFPIYEGTSQIQALMAMKDNLMLVMQRPRNFIQNATAAKARSLAHPDSLERRVARIQWLCASAIQNMVRRVAMTKLVSLKEVPVMAWVDSFMRDWDPKRHFAPAMLHAERLTRMLSDRSICEILLDQAKRHQERRDVLIRYLERAEPRVEYLHRVITTTGGRLLEKLRDLDAQDHPTTDAEGRK